MNIWDVLKIEQTKDKDALKKAYRMRLSSVNPEDDPEGFMELRKAYEEAVHLADQTEEEFDVAIPDTPEQQMLASLETLYDDYARRINPDEWLALFNSDYFVSLDTSEDALYGLLRFLMNHVLVPKRYGNASSDILILKGAEASLQNSSRKITWTISRTMRPMRISSIMRRLSMQRSQPPQRSMPISVITLN